MTRKSKSSTADSLLSQASSYAERDLVDRLREMGLDKYVELPQIAVMGDTSSGKSSLLSALSGVTFPSSEKLTTRCPTQLILSHNESFHGSVRLVRYQASGLNVSEASESLDGMDAVAGAIEKLTAKLIGEGQYISDDQIVIELCGPDLPNLTLTDLPGLVRTVADGEDPSIISRVRSLVDRFMGQERTIIIAVVPANVDLHNTEILQAAEQVDPAGVRTIAVVTKLDLIDEGAESSVHELVMNKKKFMRLGYHAVKCRSQKDLNNGVSIIEGKEREKEFFGQHEFWRRLPAHLWGEAALTKKLVEILHDNIRRSLPKVIEEINERIIQAQQELVGLGSALNTPSSRRQMFGKWVSLFLRQMEAAIMGKSFDHLSPLSMRDGESLKINDEEIQLRAKLRESEQKFLSEIEVTKEYGVGALAKPKLKADVGDPVFVELNGTWTSATVSKSAGYLIECTEYGAQQFDSPSWMYNSRPELLRFIHAHRGDELPIFPSYQVFCQLFRRWVDMWKQPTMTLLRDYRMQTKAASERAICDLDAPPRVTQYFRTSADTILVQLTQVAEREIIALLHCECRPFTQDKELFSERDTQRGAALNQLCNALSDGDKDESITDRIGRISSDDREVIEMEVNLKAYLKVSIRRFVDVVLMRLNDLVLGAFLSEMENELQGTTDDTLERLMQESERTRHRRIQLEDEIKTLRNAKDEIEEVFY